MDLKNIVQRKFRDNGDQRDWTIHINNPSNYPCHNVTITIDVPDGVAIVGPRKELTSQLIVTKGVYDPIGEKWILGSLESNEEAESNFIIEIINKDLVDENDGWFRLDATVTSSCIETDICDNITSLLLIPQTSTCNHDLSAGKEDTEHCESSTNLTIE